MHNLKLILAYEGTHYLGWQKTKEGPSIEETLENALARILQEKPKLQAASRTDAGVHAEGQVVNLIFPKKLELKKLRIGLNALLPKDMSILDIEEAASDFHPTLNSKGKEYHYYLCNSEIQLPFHRHFSWHWRLPLSLNAMQEAAAHLVGTHDFSTFCNERAFSTREGICTLFSIEFLPLPDNRLRISVKGDNFLYKMVRNMVGTLVYVGAGKIPASSLPAILASKDRTQAGITAPAHGLCLKQVYY